MTEKTDRVRQSEAMKAALRWRRIADDMGLF